MNEENAFLAAIIAQPDDTTTRLVFADWLEEHGDPDRAAFIRLQIQQSHLAEEDPACEEIQHQTCPLFEKNKSKWLADLPAWLQQEVSAHNFTRGFLSNFNKTAAKVARIPQRVWAGHPIQELALHDIAGRLNRVLALPHLNGIRDLMFLDSLTNSDWKALATCPNLTGVRELSVLKAGNPVLAALARCPSLRGLTQLYLGGDFDNKGIAALTKTGAANLGRLKRLTLDSPNIGPGTATSLATTPALAGLEGLQIGSEESGQIGDSGAAALANSPHLAGLRDVWLLYQGIGSSGACAFAKTRHMTGLRKLRLYANPLGPDGVRALVNGPWTELTELHLEGCELEDDSMEALAESGRLTALTELNLAGNRIGPNGVKALCCAKWLRSLVGLTLCGNPIGDAGVLMLCKNKVLKKLKTLHALMIYEYWGNKFSREAIEAFKQRFGDPFP